MATQIDSRFLFDSHFFAEVLKGDFELQKKLIYISSKASGNKKCQNMISKKTRDSICESHSLNESIVRMFLNKIDEPIIIEAVDEEDERTLKYAVHLTYQWPHKVIVFTASSKVDAYEKSKHYDNIKSISFVTKEDAVAVINYWFDKCREERVSNSD